VWLCGVLVGICWLNTTFRFRFELGVRWVSNAQRFLSLLLLTLRCAVASPPLSCALLLLLPCGRKRQESSLSRTCSRSAHRPRSLNFSSCLLLLLALFVCLRVFAALTSSSLQGGEEQDRVGSSDVMEVMQRMVA
jgi:hypothetical protein